MVNNSDTLKAHEIECPRCSAQVSMEHTHCPNCGLNFYMPEANDWPELEEQPDTPVETFTRQALLVLLGWLIIAGMAFVLFALLRTALRDPGYGDIWYVLVLSATAALGAWVSARFAQQAHLWVSGLVGVGAVGISILFDAFRQDLAVAGLIRPTTLLTWFVIMAVSLLLGWWEARQALRVDHLLFASPTETELYETLLARLRYDQAMLERLVDYERQRAPHGSRAQWLRSALQRWERDNR